MALLNIVKLFCIYSNSFNYLNMHMAHWTFNEPIAHQINFCLFIYFFFKFSFTNAIILLKKKKNHLNCSELSAMQILNLTALFSWWGQFKSKGILNIDFGRMRRISANNKFQLKLKFYFRMQKKNKLNLFVAFVCFYFVFSLPFYFHMQLKL